MRWAMRFRRGVPAVAAGLVSVVVAAGGAFAATSGVLSPAHAASTGHLYACADLPFGTMHLSRAGVSCPGDEEKIGWNAAGLRGPRGLTGKRGATGAAGKNGGIGPAGPQGQTGVGGPTGSAGPPGPKGQTGDSGPTGPVGPAGSSEFAEFYALMPPDNAATVAAGTAVSFPRIGPVIGSITPSSASTFVLGTGGTYHVTFQVSVTQGGQLELELNGIEQANTVVGRATGTSQIVEDALISAAPGSTLSVVNPSGAISALTITPHAGGTTVPVSASLVIERVGNAVV